MAARNFRGSKSGFFLAGAINRLAGRATLFIIVCEPDEQRWSILLGIRKADPGPIDARPLEQMRKMSFIEHLFLRTAFHHMIVKAKELTPKQILTVPCAICGAAIGEVCELHTGAPRTEPHRDRKLSAAEAVETRLGNR